MKIFFVTSKLSFSNSGGSTEEYDLIIRGLQKLGNEVTVVTVFSSFNNIDHNLPYKHIAEDLSVSDQLRIQRGVYRLLKKYSSHADFFWVDGHFFLYGAGLYRRLGGKVPVFAYFNREQICWPDNISPWLYKNLKDLPRLSLFRHLKKRLRFFIESHLGTILANSMDYFAFTNPFLDKAYADFGLKTTGKSINIGDPLDFKAVLEQHGITEDFYLQHNKREGKIVLFYSSRMIAGKGFDLLLEAFAKVKNKEKFHLILGGTGPEEELIKQKVCDLNLESYVEMPGWSTKEQLHEHLKKADIFVQARWRKDMSSMSLTEAMVFGLPSIIPSGGGIEWVGGKSSLCFKPDDVDDLTAKIEILGNDYDLRAKLSRECYPRLCEPNVNYQKTVLAMATIMERLVGQFGKHL